MTITVESDNPFNPMEFALAGTFGEDIAMEDGDNPDNQITVSVKD